MLKASLAPLLLATAALLLGVPTYWFLERWASSSPAFLDCPWPLWLAEAVAGLLCASLAIPAGKAARRRAAIGGLAIALASSGGLAALVMRDLPESSSEVAVGRLLPESRLSDELGRPVSLASLRGQPAVLVFYRGALCVACRKQLSALAARVAPFIAAGVRVRGSACRVRRMEKCAWPPVFAALRSAARSRGLALQRGRALRRARRPARKSSLGRTERLLAGSGAARARLTRCLSTRPPLKFPRTSLN
jgi:hypothetical protein